MDNEVYNLMQSATRYLDSVKDFYPNGLPTRKTIADAKVPQVKSDIPELIIAGDMNAQYVFILTADVTTINNFFESEDGKLLTSLLQNALKINEKNTCICIFQTLNPETLKNFIALQNFSNQQNIICFGEEFSILSDFDNITFNYIADPELDEAERGLGLFNTAKCVFGYSLQELRLSPASKKYFWQKIVNAGFK
jgi:hypothetical protein